MSSQDASLIFMEVPLSFDHYGDEISPILFSYDEMMLFYNHFTRNTLLTTGQNLVGIRPLLKKMAF